MVAKYLGHEYSVGQAHLNRFRLYRRLRISFWIRKLQNGLVFDAFSRQNPGPHERAVDRDHHRFPWGQRIHLHANGVVIVRGSMCIVHTSPSPELHAHIVDPESGVCFSTDALNWSDRGGAGYKGQHALASNLMHLGMSFAGFIAYEDLRVAEFVSQMQEVDSKKIAAMGLSMGSFRAWQLAALSNDISCGAAICWMTTVKGVMVPGNNQTGGQSAFALLHPGLSRYLDYPDVASIACPKPMLFYNGLQDSLFPVDSVKKAYNKMHEVWKSQDADNYLETRLWDVSHTFDKQMQEAAFDWLDVNLGKASQ